MIPLSAAAAARGKSGSLVTSVIQAGLPLASDPAGQPDARGEARRLGRRAEGLVALGVGEVPDGRRDELAGPVLGEGVGVPHGPPGMGADPLQAEARRLLDRGRLVGGARHRLHQLEEGRLLAERDLGLLALGDVAPRLDDLERFAGLVADQALLVPHPAVGAVLAAEPVLAGVVAELQQPRELGQDARQVLGMDPLQPEAPALRGTRSARSRAGRARSR